MKKAIMACLMALCPVFVSAVAGTVEVSAETGVCVIDVTEYGADASGKKDSTEAVIEALNYAEEMQDENAGLEIVLNFPEGTYQLYPDKAEERELYVSNTVGANQDYKNKKIGILVEDLDNLTIEGNGSDFICHGKMTVFAAIRSENIEFRNFSVDFAVPTTVDITVESVEGDTATVYIPECYNYAVENGELHWYSEKSPYTGEHYWSGINRFENYYNQSIDLETGITARQNQLFDNCWGIEDLGNRRVKFSYSGRPESVQPGMCYQMRPTLRDTPGTFFWLSKDVRMENLDIQYLHGFGMVGQTTENVTLKDVDFKAPEETGRTTAGYADFLQMSGCKGKIQIEDCYFANPHDDPINIHGTFQQVVAISSDRREVTVRYNHNETAGFPSFAPGDEVEFTRQSDLIPVDNAVCTVEEIISGPTGDGSGNGSLTDTTIRFTEPIPEEVREWEYAAENITFTPEVEIRNCIFKEIPTRGILVTTRKPVVIEENVFEGTSMAAIYISCDAQSWYESGRVEDVTIRNNDFYRCKGDGVIFVEPTNPDVSTEKTVHKNIQIEGNRFYQEGNCVVNAKSVDGIRIANNEIYRFEPDVEVKISADGSESCTIGEGESLQTGVDFHEEQWDWDLYVFNGCKNVQLENNTYDTGLKMNASIWNMQRSDIQIADGEDISVGNGGVTDSVDAVYYESSEPQVAAVSQDGVIMGISQGEAEIRAYMVNNGKKYVSGTLAVTVGGSGDTVPSEDVEQEDSGIKVLSDAFEIIRPVRETWKLSGEELCIWPEGHGNWADGNRASNIFLTKAETTDNLEIVVQMEGKTQEGYEETGLVLYQDDDNYSALQRKHANGSPRLNLTTETNQSPSEDGIEDPAQETIWLKMVKEGDLVSGYYSTDGEEWQFVYEQENAGLGDSFKVGILCTCGNGVTPITFRNFMVNGTENPFGKDLEIPTVLSNCNLESVECENIAFEEFERTRKYYVAEAGGEKTANFRITPEEGAQTRVLLNGQVVSEQEEAVDVPLQSGINAVEMFVTAEDGVSQSVYRYAIMNYVETEEVPPAEERDETALRQGIAFAQRLQEEQEKYGSYTEASWQRVQIALEEAEAVLADTSANQEAVDEAFLNLITACNLLENDVQKAGLKAVIDGAKDILADQDAISKYTDESVKALEKAVQEAERVYQTEGITQEKINEASRSVIDAVTALLVKNRDTRLDILIQKAEELLGREDAYTSESIQRLKDALANAKETAENSQATQEELQESYNNLAEAMASLVRKANKEELANAIEKAEEILKNQDKYLPSTIAGLEKVLKDAKAVYEQDNAQTKAVSEAVKKLVDEILKARLMGDVDGNGAVEPTDASMVLCYSAEMEELTEEQRQTGDVNKDAKTDSSDAEQILRYAAEKINSFED